MNVLEKLQTNQIIILDGGTGTEIQRLGGEMSTAWGAVANIKSPEVVIKVHESHINAGCDIVTTNTFATCRHALESIGYEDQTEHINRLAVNLAKTAIKNSGKENEVLIAGSMTNFFPLLENEYRADPRFVPDFKTEENNYKEMAKILSGSGVDIIILEMLVDIEHSKILLNAALETGLPVWVGLSCCINKYNNIVVGRNFGVEKNETLIYDKKKIFETPRLLPEDKIIPLKDIIISLTSIGGDVFGIMHSWIEDTKAGLKVLKKHWAGPIMAYPEIVLFDASTGGGLNICSEEEFAESCFHLIDSKINIIGGCCGVSHNYLKEMINRIHSKRNLDSSNLKL